MMRTSSSRVAICSRTRLARASYSSIENNTVIHPSWDRMRTFQCPLSANLQNGQHVDADHIREVDDIDPLVGHGVVAAAGAADDAFHPAEIVQMTGISPIEAARGNGACRLPFAAYRAIGAVDGLHDRA